MISVLRAAFVFYSHLKCLGSLALSPHSPGQVTAAPPAPGSAGLDPGPCACLCLRQTFVS